VTRDPSAGSPDPFDQLAEVPGVVGSLAFDTAGAVTRFGLPATFDRARMQGLARRLTEDLLFRGWLGEEQATMALRFVDGQVVIRAMAGGWLLVLCTLQVNLPLLERGLAQATRRP
jgi:hypothetical protein